MLSHPDVLDMQAGLVQFIKKMLCKHRILDTLTSAMAGSGEAIFVCKIVVSPQRARVERIAKAFATLDLSSF